MNIENILNAVKPIVEARCYSKISPTFFILDDGDAKDDNIINALALSVAVFGGNCVVAKGRKENIVRAFTFFEADGLFEISRDEKVCDLIFTPRGKVEEKFVTTRLSEIPQTGKISTFSVEKMQNIP